MKRFLLLLLSFCLLCTVYCQGNEADLNSEEDSSEDRSDERQQKRVKPPQCLQDCIGGLVKMPRDINYVITKLEDTCAKYIEAGECVKNKCQEHLVPMFQRVTTFHRVNCIDFIEKLEPHIECLSKASVNISTICGERCRKHAPESAELLQSLNEREKALKQLEDSCNAVVCNSKCTYEHMTGLCPRAQDVLMQVHVKYAEDAGKGTDPGKLSQAPDSCQVLHNRRRMRRVLLLNTSGDWTLEWISEQIPKMSEDDDRRNEPNGPRPSISGGSNKEL